MDAAALKQFEAFIEQCKSNPSLSFFRDYIDSLGRGVGGLSQFLNDREVMGAFQDPEVMAALQDVLNQSEDFIEHCKCNPSILSFSSLSSLGMIPAIPILPATATIPAIASGDSKVVDESDKKFFDCEEETRAMLGQCEEMSALLNNVVPNAHKLEEHLSLGTLNIALGLNSGEALVVMDTRGTKQKKDCEGVVFQHVTKENCPLIKNLSGKRNKDLWRHLELKASPQGLLELSEIVSEIEYFLETPKLSIRDAKRKIECCLLHRRGDLTRRSPWW